MVKTMSAVEKFLQPFVVGPYESIHPCRGEGEFWFERFHY